MPEIKNSFQRGVMNKDLDERLVPNGQYRDAMNVQVSTSEESDVGTVQNILGNTRVENIVGDGFTCVSALADEKNNVLYWFVTSNNVDAIIEYSHDGIVTPILVDTNKNVLNFNVNNIITGVNIIDNLLFWTDGVNEPKKINIETFKNNQHVDLSTHSEIFFIDNQGNNTSIPVEERHITVVRKKPTKAPDVKFVETGNFSLIDIDNLNVFGLGVGSVLSSITISGDPFSVGDIVLISEENASGSLPQNYQIKLRVTNKSASVYDFEILEILQSYIDKPFNFKAVRDVDINPLFEKEFVRFATRYKYADGEFSAFSPFTQPVFVSGRFGFHPTKDPYNLGMENKLLNIVLVNLIQADAPEDIVQLDILFKTDRSPVVYSIDSIKPNDDTDYWRTNNSIISGGYFGVKIDGTLGQTGTLSGFPTGEYEITVENIYAALPANQLLRPYDNVPKKALAQEITGSRLVYGNYTQNYDIVDQNNNLITPGISIEKEERGFYFNETPSFSENLGLKSIKSLRKYEIGVVYGDEYGRETPVFTNKGASINIPYQEIKNGQEVYNAARSLRLKAKLSGNQPFWADYYKFYIKQTSGEYYNLTMDRVYKSQEDFNLYLSFPSSDRNKIKEGDYLILKKQVDIEQVVPVEEKIKIIDIKNEAPDAIKFDFVSLGTGGGNATDLAALFTDSQQQPAEDVAKLLIDKEAWLDLEGSVDIVDDAVAGERLALQFTILQSGVTIKSKKYSIASLKEVATGTQGSYEILLDNAIDAEDNWVESSIGVLNADDQLSVTIFKRRLKDFTEFDGRFFVKVISNAVTQTYLIPSTQDFDVYRAVGRMTTFVLADSQGDFDSDLKGIYNTDGNAWTNTTGNFISNLESEWHNATTFDTGVPSSSAFFIDYAGFKAFQADSSTNLFDAGSSGRFVKGNDLFKASQYVNGFEGIVSPNQSPGAGSKYSLKNAPLPGTPNGGRHFSDTVIRMKDNQASFAYQSVAASGASFDDTYVPIDYNLPNGGQSGHYMHLSISCIGSDLHDGTMNEYPGGHGLGTPDQYIGTGTLPSDSEIRADIASNLQGISANTCYTARTNYTDPAEYSNNSDLAFGQFGLLNYVAWNQINNNASEHQFNPAHNNTYVAGVIDNLVAGQQFQINGDPNVYTIKKVRKKLVYNHTPWNLCPFYPETANPNNNSDVEVITSNTTGDITDMSVAEAYSRLHASGFGSAEYTDFKNVLQNFGRANNRRVTYILELDKSPVDHADYATNLATTNATTPIEIKFVDGYLEDGENRLPTSPAIFETEPKEDTDLNIYFEASDAIPLTVEQNSGNKGEMFAPIGTKVICNLNGADPTDWVDAQQQAQSAFPSLPSSIELFLKVKNWDGNTLQLTEPGLFYDETSNSGFEASNYLSSPNNNVKLRFVRQDGSYTEASITSITIPTVDGSGQGAITELTINEDVYNNHVGLPYYNCFSFGNGVESNRIRDDFNESFISNGVRASAVLEQTYEEENRKHGLIFSGLYNSTSGINNLNQFIQAEKITKDLLPTYGSIQKLYARDRDLITLCEDKILKIFVDRDLLFNADGNAQLLSTDRFLGEAQPFRGNYGISKNPESFAAESFRVYFADKQRGAVLRLSIDGLTPISDAGMKNYFKDTFEITNKALGSYDANKKHYNLTLKPGGVNLITNPNFDQGGSFTESVGSELLSNTDFSITSDSYGPNLIANGDDAGLLANSTLFDICSSGSFTTNSARLIATSAGAPSQQFKFGINLSTNPLNIVPVAGDVVTLPFGFGTSASSFNLVVNTASYDDTTGVVTVSVSHSISTTVALQSGLDEDGNPEDFFPVPIGETIVFTRNLGIFGNPDYSTFVNTQGVNFFSPSNAISYDSTQNKSIALNDNTGSFRFDGSLGINNDGIAIDITSANIQVGEVYKVTFNMFNADANTAGNGSVKLRARFFNANGEGAILSEESVYPNTNTGEKIYEYTGMVGDHTATNDNVKGYLIINNSGTPGPTLNIDNIQFQKQTSLEVQDFEYEGFDFNTYSNIAFNDPNIENLQVPVNTLSQDFNFEHGKRYKATVHLSNVQALVGEFFADFNSGPDVKFVSVGQNNYEAILDTDTQHTNNDKLIIKQPEQQVGTGLNFGSLIPTGIAIETVSLKEIIPTAGTIQDWNLLGEDDEIFWKPDLIVEEPGYIVFDDAVTDTRAEQGLNLINNSLATFNQGDTYSITFTISDYSGTGQLTGYLYNDDGLGFEVGPVSANGTYTFLGTIGQEQQPPAGHNTNVVGFGNLGDGNLSCRLDNIILDFGPDFGKTITYNENSKGWVSFKSFIPDFSISCVNQYYTMKLGQLWKHHTNQNRNTFYENFTQSSVTPLLNAQSGLVKHFNTLNYEGTQAKVDQWTHSDLDGQYYNLQQEQGWYVSDIKTDKQEGSLNEFIEKEGKWFNYIKGKSSHVDPSAFNFQGVGIVKNSN